MVEHKEGEDHRGEAHWIELQLIGWADGLSIQGDTNAVKGVL
jgi:hypothetical protein